MNRIIPLVLLCAATCTAQAQSSLTLYGRVASGLDFVSNVAQPDGSSKSNFRFGSNQYGISWWGLKGTEDLGAGWNAVVNLESMFTAGTGNVVNNSLFNRYAYVGLSNSDYGSLWLGAAMSLTDETSAYLDPIGGQVTSLAALVYGRSWGPRSNTVTYNSPNFRGFSFRLQRGFGNRAGNFRGGTTTSSSFTYAFSGVQIYGVYDEIRDVNGGFSSLYSASREYLGGATYTWKGLKFFAAYQQLVSSGQTTIVEPNNPTAATRSQQAWVGLTYQATPFFQVEGGLYRSIVNHDGGTGTLGVVGATYLLSKRTILYSTLGLMFNGGNAAFPVEANDSPPLAGHNQQGFYFGMMHYF
ncbi:porin [Burkholderia multivorans]|uniref:porin n=1 Tax=Burkholderia multivorans TaxID=87883 RepID=UPI0021BFC7DB|nr:porin [Burkholderia multivorans]